MIESLEYLTKASVCVVGGLSTFGEGREGVKQKPNHRVRRALFIHPCLRPNQAFNILDALRYFCVGW